MAVARGQITIIDLSDGKSINVYLTSNKALSQIYSEDSGSMHWNNTTGIISTVHFIAGKCHIVTELAVHKKILPWWIPMGPQSLRNTIYPNLFHSVAYARTKSPLRLPKGF